MVRCLTIYTAHELDEEVTYVMKLAQKGLLASPASLALNSVHGVAFHRGLGEPLYATSSTPFTKYLDAETIWEFSGAAYAKNNFAVVANGASHSELSKWVNEFFADVGTGSQKFKIESQATKYFGGEERIAHDSGNVMILGFPGSSSFTSGSSYKPEIAVLAALLGGESSIKWSPGFSLLSKAAKDFPFAQVSTQHAAYSDAGLLYVTIAGNAQHVAKASKEVVDTLKKVASGDVAEEDIKKATALAKFRALEAGQQTQAGLEATGTGLLAGGKPFQIDEVGAAIDKVTSEKVKAVSVRCRTGNVAIKLTFPLGCEGLTRIQGFGVNGRRFVCSSICLRHRFDSLRETSSVSGWHGWRRKTCKYQNSCTKKLTNMVSVFVLSPFSSTMHLPRATSAQHKYSSRHTIPYHCHSGDDY